VVGIRQSCWLVILFVCSSETNQWGGMQCRHIFCDWKRRRIFDQLILKTLFSSGLNVISTVCSCHNWCNGIQSSTARRSMITHQRGDQRRCKSHVYISTVCLLSLIYTSSSFYRGWRERTREENGARAWRGRESAKREDLHKTEFESCVARATQKFIDLSDALMF